MPPNTRSNSSTRFSARSSHFSNNNINEGAPVAILNTRMKNLSQFSFKYRENERPITSRQQHQQNQKHMYNHNRRNCRTCFQVSFFSVLLLAIVLGGFQLELVSISWVISHMTLLVENLFQKKILYKICFPV